MLSASANFESDFRATLVQPAEDVEFAHVSKRPKKRRNPVCPFCQTREAPATKEDIFARWIARLWPDGGLFRVDVIDPDGRLERTYGAKGNLGFVLTKPCKNCNNGWMNDLENAAIPILAPTIQGQPRTLTFAECRTLARWMVKTSIMFEFLQRRPTRYFTRRDRIALFESLSIRRVLLFLARYVPRTEPTSGWFQEYPMPLQITAPIGAQEDVDAYVATFAIGQLVLQLFAHRSRLPTLVLRSAGDWTDATVQAEPPRTRNPVAAQALAG